MSLSTTVSALTRDKFIPILVDNIYNSNVLCYKLLKNAEKLDGGVKIVTPIEYAKQDANQGWLTPGSGSATGQAMGEVAQKAEWSWATAYNSIVVSGDEEYVNMGASQVVSMLKAKLSNAEKAIKDLFGSGIFNSGAVSNGLTSLNGAGTVASGDNSALNIDGDANTFSAPGEVDNTVCGTARSLGGIDSDGDTWWDAKVGSFATFSDTDSTASTFDECVSVSNGVAEIVKKMTQMYGACSIDNDQPDLIVTTQTIYDAYESSIQGNKRFEGDATLGDAGFQSLRFKGASVVVDSHCPAGHMYMLNTKYLDYKVHSKRNFSFEDFARLEASDKIQARIFWMGQLVCTAPRMQGLLVGGPTSY